MSTGKVGGGGGPIEFNAKANDGVQSNKIRKQELDTKGSNEISRTETKAKSQGLISRGISYLRNLWSGGSSSKSVNTKMAGLASQAMKPPPTAEKSSEQSEVQQTKPAPRPRPGPGIRPPQKREVNEADKERIISAARNNNNISDFTRKTTITALSTSEEDIPSEVRFQTPSNRSAAARPGPGIRPKTAERSNYNAMTPEVGRRPLPSPGQKFVDRSHYNAMTPEAMKKALESEEAISEHVDNAINEMLAEEENSQPPTDLPPVFEENSQPPSDLPPTLTQKLQDAMRDFNVAPREDGEIDDWDEEVAVEEPVAGQPEVKNEDSGNSLLNEIKGGKQLRKVVADEGNKVEEQKVKEQSDLDKTLEARRKALTGELDSVDESDDW